MSMKQYAQKKEYIVTLFNREDLDQFYNDMETLGGDNYIPSREVMVADRREVSRNTHYWLTEFEALELGKDPRVRNVSVHPRYLGVKAGLSVLREQTSTTWNKSSSTNNNMVNWGLLRCWEGTNRSGWGSNGTTNQTGTIKLPTTGKNVDVVIIDGDGIIFAHPEYKLNPDGTGSSRAIAYNWAQHDPVVKGSPAGTYFYGTSDHATHVSATVAGNTQGWAREANIYNIYYLAGDGFDYNFPYVMDYVREFHRTKSVNQSTGRKNPTITNNSWGMSIFPSEWAFNDITAVTYRGTRYAPTGLPTYLGISGVCTSNARLSQLAGFENHGNRITTTGPYVAPGGSVLTIPPTWLQEGQQAYITLIGATGPDPVYEITVQGPADINLYNSTAIDAVSGSMSITNSIEIYQGTDPTPIAVFSDGPYSTTNGGTIEATVDQLSYSLPNTAVYTIKYISDIDVSLASSPTFASALSATVVTESTPATATVTTITNTMLGAGALTSATVPNFGSNDDGYWELILPFTIDYLGSTYDRIFVGTNFYLTFGAGSDVYSNLSVSSPNLPKIMLCAGDRSVQRIYYGTEGSAPNRTYRVRVEGSTGTSGAVGSPTMVCEYVFYEATTSQIDLQIGINSAKLTGGGFSTEQLNAWGFISGQRIPKRVDALDSDIEDAIKEGIIYVGAGGNGRWKHCLPGDPDWDNTFEMATRYPDSVNNPYYYMRGSSPTANDTFDPQRPFGDQGYDLPNICVGSIDVTVADVKASYSDCGPGVDIFAPGTNIISALPSGVSDSRNNSFFLGKFSGTSMASPQVCGVLACALENNPFWTQIQAKQYIIDVAKSNQIVNTSGGPADSTDLQGAPNKYLYYKREREDTGTMVPKQAIGTRPTTGVAWPRSRIRRFR